MRKALTVTLAGAAVAVAGCSAPPPPEVTFYTDGNSAAVSPRLLCEIGKPTCLEDPDAVANLKTRLGQPVQISVSEKVASTPWGVVFSYVDANGQQQVASSRAIFPSSGQLTYTLKLPAPTDRLIYVEVRKTEVIDGSKLVDSGIWALSTELRS
ncbi:DUF2771 family protein [Actinokineospora inagensis]|uniref:DUF2771 family protein n=1 Tax=Actinokineospora inagensis TaxID=103730 RepID=UPI000411FC8F|nr:DUF2771 family protein [Actinokineospora inagensis]